MPSQTIKGKGFTWWHFSELEEKDFRFLEDEFKFHPLDFDDLRDEPELSKIDVYKHYLFSVINVPVFDQLTMQVGKQNLAVFVGRNYLVTITHRPIESVERFFARMKRSSGLKRDVFSQSSGYLLYKILDYVFSDVHVILRQLVRETERVEHQVYDAHTRVTTKHLGILRRNVLYMRHIIEPMRLLINQFVGSGKTFLPKELAIYFDDVHDRLNGISVVTDNLKQIVDGLFDVNEAFLSHRTNDIIRLLTIISVVLMPPMLITSYYGMNVSRLPFANDILIVTVIILFSLFAFWFIVIGIDKRQK